MGCSSGREKIEEEMMNLILIRTEIQMDRENKINQLSEIEGKKIKYKNIPDYIDSKFAFENQIYNWKFIEQLEQFPNKTNDNEKSRIFKKLKKNRRKNRKSK